MATTRNPGFQDADRLGPDSSELDVGGLGSSSRLGMPSDAGFDWLDAPADFASNEPACPGRPIAAFPKTHPGIQ